SAQDISQRMFSESALIEPAQQKDEFRALRLSEARLKLGVDISGIGLGEIDYVAGTILLDDRAAELFDLPASERMPRSLVHGRFHEEDFHRLQGQIAQLLGPQGDGSLIAEHRIRLANGEVRWLHARKQITYHFDSTGQRRPFNGLLAVLDVTERKKADERLQLLNGEIAHRCKNLLAVVQAIARQTFGATKASEKGKLFEDRLMSVAASQDLLINSDWRGVDLRTLIVSQLQHFAELSTKRVQVTGPDLKVNVAAAQAIGMAIHELATNAAKYGSLSNDDGVVDIRWEVSDEDGGSVFACRWTESGGPEVKAPTRNGFGQGVLVKAPTTALNARVQVDYLNTGVVWRLRAPVAAVLDSN
ncbi:MAG: Blue-light-activated histidine kinase, partial [Hyphomicrobiales bacterium]|nr:Blue-light-activated histidine kinase [Hyphomicrobiales bacterium]